MEWNNTNTSTIKMASNNWDYNYNNANNNLSIPPPPPPPPLHTISSKLDLTLGATSNPMAGFSFSDHHSLLLPAQIPPPSRRPRENKEASCLVEGCKADLSKCREYHRKHKVCEQHSKTPVVKVGGKEQRFCQQCSRFHSLVEFDEAKRSCRKRLAGHNRRRRKPPPTDPQSPAGGIFVTHHGARMPPYQQIYPTSNITQEEPPPKWNPTMRNDHSALRSSIFSSSSCTDLGALQQQGALSLLSSSSASTASVSLGQQLTDLHGNIVLSSSENVVPFAGFRYCNGNGNGVCPYLSVGEGSENGSGHNSLPFSWQ